MNWSRREINRTVEEIKGRSSIDPEFRALVLSDPLAAIGRVNPRPLPEGFSIRFVEPSEAAIQHEDSVPIIVLSEPLARVAELTDDELQQAAGGDSGPSPKLRT